MCCNRNLDGLSDNCSNEVVDRMDEENSIWDYALNILAHVLDEYSECEIASMRNPMFN